MKAEERYKKIFEETIESARETASIFPCGLVKDAAYDAALIGALRANVEMLCQEIEKLESEKVE